MALDFHRHCQASVLSANGTEQNNGATWGVIGGLTLNNLPKVDGATWNQLFSSNRDNITQDLATMLKLIDQVAGQVNSGLGLKEVNVTFKYKDNSTGTKTLTSQDSDVSLDGLFEDEFAKLWKGRTLQLSINGQPLTFNTMIAGSGETHSATIDVGDKVVVTPSLDRGTIVATIKVGNDTKTLYAPTPTSTDTPATISTPVGTIISWIGETIPDGYLLCDGREVSKETYSDLYAVIGDKFGTASSGKFKLPLLTDNRYLQGNTTSGNYVDAGLPNITGELSELRKYKTETLVKSGAFETSSGVTNKTMTTGQITGETGVNIVFNASKSNAIYGKSNTVTPKSMTVLFLICYKKYDSSCVSYVIESGKFCSSDGTIHSNASENDSWYRLYSDGWCEQGGTNSNLDDSTDWIVHLHKSFSDTNYSINALPIGKELSKASSYLDVFNIENNNFIIRTWSSITDYVDWKVKWEAKGFVS